MKVPMRWLKDYVDIKCDAQDYAKAMVMGGNGVEEIVESPAAFSCVVVGRVLRCEKLQGSDHLHVCQVDAGQGEPLQVVCGAPNVCEGALVPVALAGAKLPGGHTIKKGKLRGVESHGMLCSGAELQVSPGLYPNCGDEGLLLFQEDYTPGTDVREIFGMMDQVVDFEILANRPDCLSVWGIARESAAVLGEYCFLPEISVVEDGQGTIADYASVQVRDSEKCPRYCARVIRDVKIAPSPAWMRQYLSNAGVRPINNIVDITNFVMLETGHPMHAFDLSKVRDQSIVVRRARAGETLTTLDGKTHQLTEEMLVIADAQNATGLAGIMGGVESEIVSDTRAVLFECAAFDRTSTRLTSRALGIRTESGGRFERGVRAQTAMEALMRACMLVNDLSAGKVVPGAIDIYPNQEPQTQIEASVARINQRISTQLDGEQMEDILIRLGLDVTLCGDTLTCLIPEWRGDLLAEADLSEEVLRLYGYDHIPSTLPKAELTAGFRSPMQLLSDRAKQSLIGMGFYEAMNFSFVSPKWAQSLLLPEGDWRLSPVVIKNPLGEDTSVMRTSLVPSMLQALSTNINRSNPEGMLFELASVFKKGAAHELPEEPKMLAIGMYGDGADFFRLRDCVYCLLQRFGIEPKIENGGDLYLHPGRKAVLSIDGTTLGQLGEAHPDVCDRFAIEGRRVYIAELHMDAIMASQQQIQPTRALPRFPAVSRDLALVVDEAQGVGPLMEGVREAAGKLLEELKLFDIYRGAQLGEGKKSVAFSLTLRAADRTLTEEEIAKTMEKVLAQCAQRYGASIRS